MSGVQEEWTGDFCEHDDARDQLIKSKSVYFKEVSTEYVVL